MNVSNLIKSCSAAAAAGTACYMLVSASNRKKNSIKRHAGKALRAAGAVLEDITSIVR